MMSRKWIAANVCLLVASMVFFATMIASSYEPTPGVPSPNPLAEDLSRANRLIAEVFGHDPAGFELESTLSYPVDITAYSLSVDECDDDPLQAAFGPSRPFMAALSRSLEEISGLKKGDRFAVLSDDGEVRAVCIFWDRMSSRWEGLRLDIVAPAKEVALWNGVKSGRLVKVVGRE